MNIDLNNLVPVSEIQKNYRKIFDRVKKTRQPIILMRDSEADIALIDVKTLAQMQKDQEEFDSWKETQEILNDQELMKSIRQGEKDIAEGQVYELKDARKEFGWDV